MRTMRNAIQRQMAGRQTLPHQRQESSNMRQNLMQKENGQVVKTFAYTFEFSSVLATASATTSVNIEADSSFIWTQTTAYGFITGQNSNYSTQIIPDCLIQIVDTASNSNMFDRPIPLQNMSGLGSEPFINPMPSPFNANSVVKATIDNLSANIYKDIYITMMGYKEFN